MVSVDWCCRQEKGIRLVEPSQNISQGYISLAESSIGTMNRERDKNIVFSISAGYYSMYYSLCSVLIALGIKCEIHKCTIKFAEEFLRDFYNKEDIKTIYEAFSLRNSAQYYVNKILNEQEILNLIKKSPIFVAKSMSILSSLNEKKIEEARNRLKKRGLGE